MQRKLPYFQRACLLTRNMGKALQVYCDLLGFTLEYQSADKPDSYSYDIFNIPRDIPTRFATLSSEQQQRTLALIEVPDASFFGSNTRLAAAVIHTESVTELLRQAQALGLKTLPPQLHPAPEQGPGRQEACLYDFDGHPVVIYQILAAEQGT